MKLNYDERIKENTKTWLTKTNKMANYSSETTELDNSEKYADFTLNKGWKG
jgi:hypothetical protein